MTEPEVTHDGARPPNTDQPPSEVTGKRLLRNTIVNGFANASNAIVTIILTPFLLSRLGDGEYGLWILALSLTFTSGYFALADIGLSEASVKLIAEAEAVGARSRISEVASTTIATFAALGVAIGVIAIVLAPTIVDVFNIDDSLQGTARVLFAIMAFEIMLELPSAALRAVIEGLQRYSWLRSIDVSGRILWGVLAVLVVGRAHGVVSLAVLTVIVTSLRTIATFVAAHHLADGLKLRPSLVTRAMFRETAAYGSFVGGLRFLSVIYSQMDRAILAIMVSVVAVASYEVVFRIQSIATLVLVMASSAVLPAAAYNAMRVDEEKQRELYLRGTKYTIAIALPVCIAALLYAPLLIEIWVGEKYVDEAFAARLFLIFPMLGSVNQIGVTMLIGLGKARRVLVLQAAAVFVNLVVSIILVGPWGITGAVVGTLVGGLVAWLPYVRLLMQTFEIDLRSWLRRVLLPNAPGALVQTALGLMSLAVFDGADSFIALIALFGSSCFANAITFAAMGLKRDERNHLVSLVRRPGHG